MNEKAIQSGERKKSYQKLDEYIKENLKRPLFEKDGNEDSGDKAFEYVCGELQRYAFSLNPVERESKIYDEILAIDKEGGENRKGLRRICVDLVNGADDVEYSAKAAASVDEANGGSGGRTVTPDNYRQKQVDVDELDLYIRQNKSRQTLYNLVNEFMIARGLTSPQVYSRARLSRQDFSRIMNPKKNGVSRIAVYNLAIGLALDHEETKRLLRSAGYAYNKSNMFDVIVMYHIDMKIYDVCDINIALYDHNESKLLYDSYEPNVKG